MRPQCGCAPAGGKGGVRFQHNAQTVPSHARSQIDYMLGSNDAQRSFVIGYGSSYPARPHHRAATSSPGAPYTSGTYSYVCDDATDAPHTLRGALVGGAERSTDYVDDW